MKSAGKSLVHVTCHYGRELLLSVSLPVRAGPVVWRLRLQSGIGVAPRRGGSSALRGVGAVGRRVSVYSRHVAGGEIVPAAGSARAELWRVGRVPVGTGRVCLLQLSRSQQQLV